MIQLLDNGYLAIPGEKGVHSTLVELVNFYQKNLFLPHEELLTQPCGQENENNVDYEEISLSSNVAVDGKTRPMDSSSAYMPKPCSSPPISVSLRPISPPWKRMTEKIKSDRPNSFFQPWSKSLDQSPVPSYPQRSGKALLNDAPQKIWKSLKTLPQNGKKITKQIKNHLSDVKLFPSSALSGSQVKSQARGAPGLVGNESATHMKNNHPERGTQNLPSNVYPDPFERAPLVEHISHSKTQELHLLPRKMVGTSTTPILASEEVMFPGPRRGMISGTTWHYSSKSASDKLGYFPEEYYPPPPFAPGY
ncbi:hematopoietic SH2 domain-containing protein isoform X3 [Notamacropus eugenii]